MGTDSAQRFSVMPSNIDEPARLVEPPAFGSPRRRPGPAGTERRGAHTGVPAYRLHDREAPRLGRGAKRGGLGGPARGPPSANGRAAPPSSSRALPSGARD